MFQLCRNGQCIRFAKGGSKGAPVFGRTARGNKGISLTGDDEVVDMLLVPAGTELDDESEVEDETVEAPDEAEVGAEDGEEGDDLVLDEEPDLTLLTITTLGYGKRTPLDEYRVQGRNGKGIISHKTGGEVGEVVRARPVSADDQLMLVTDTGRVIRISAGSVRLVKSRGSKGVRLMRLDDGERIVDMARLVEDEEEGAEGEE